MVVLASLILMTLPGFLITQKRINQKIQKTKKEKEATALNSKKKKKKKKKFLITILFLFLTQVSATIIFLKNLKNKDKTLH